MSSVSLIRQFRSNANAGSLRAGGQPGTLALVAPILVMAFGWPVPPAHAGVVDVAAGANVTHDSNLFRQSGSVGPSSDVISSGYLGLRIDKPYAQQRFQLDVTETTTRYQEFSRLNFDSLAYRGAWLWHLTPRISGTLGADRTESLIPFEDSLGTSRNVRTIDNRLFSLDASITGGWHLLFGLSRSEQASEQGTGPDPDFNSSSREAGIRYQALSGSSVSLRQRSTQGEYATPTVGNDDYRQNESELQVNWILSGKSIVTGRLTRLDRNNDQVPERDFSGLAGKLGYTWNPAAKLTIDFVAQRDILPWQESNAAYRVDNTISLVPTWQASARITALARVEQIKSYFRGDALASGFSRSDSLRNLLVGADWNALRSLTIGVNVQDQRRTSDDSRFAYHATLANIRIVALF